MTCLPSRITPGPHSRIYIYSFLTCSLFLFDLAVSPESRADLPPKVKQQIINDGLKAGDQDQQVQDLEDQIKKNPPNKKDLEKTRDDLKERINAKKGAAEVSGGTEGKKLFEKAREARNKQHKLKELEEEFEKTKDKRTGRKINSLKFQLDNDYKDLGKLPEIAMTSPAGVGNESNGSSLTMGKIQQGHKDKGTVNLGSGKAAANTFVSLNNMNLRSLGTVSFASSLETVQHLLDENRDENQESGLGGRWPKGSESTPVVGQLAGNQYEYVAAPDNFFSSHAFTMFNSEPFTHTGSLGQVKATFGIGFNAGSTSVPFEKYYGRLSVKAEYRFDEVFIPDWDSYIYRYSSGFNSWQVGEQFKQQNGIDDFSWNLFNGQIGNYSDFQQPPTIKMKWDWAVPDNILQIEPNFGVSGAPAPGFHPESWPHTKAFPLPRLVIQGVR